MTKIEVPAEVPAGAGIVVGVPTNVPYDVRVELWWVVMNEVAAVAE